MIGKRRLAALLAGCAAIGLGSAARAETLADAIAAAYQSNPTLQAQRAQQRVLDESYVQARVGYRPTVTLSANAQYSREDFGAGGGAGSTATGAIVPSAGGGTFETNSGGAQISVSQLLFNGGRTAAGVQAALASVLAGREALLTTEQSVLQSVVQAYEDTRRDQQIVGIRRNNVAVLSHQFDETNAKFIAGQVTRTDTAQAEAQLAASRSLLTSAQAQLQISRAAYTAVVGRNPGELAIEPPLPGLPASVDQAFDVAETDNPALLQAEITEQSSRARIAEAKAANRPSVALQGSVGYVGPVSPLEPRDYDRAITATATITQPLFTGGLNSSNIRVALEQNNTDRINIETARRQVVQNVSQAWNTMVAAQANTGSDEEQVRAASVAFEGEQAEYTAGLRTTLDVLISQENLRDAELALVQARHDQYVAQATLLNAMGHLEASRLVGGVPLYDPAVSFNKVKHAGAVPWEGVVETLDTLGAPSPGKPKAIPSPPAPAGPVTMLPADQPVPTRQPFSTAQPTAPH